MEPKKGVATKKDLERVERTLGEKIDGNSEKIEENSNKIDRVKKTLSEKIDGNSRKIDRNSEKIDRVAIQVVKNSEAINKMVTKEEFNQFRHDVLSGQDKMMTILTRLDQERIFTTEWIRRIEGDVERNKGEIKRIKERLAIA